MFLFFTKKKEISQINQYSYIRRKQRFAKILPPPPFSGVDACDYCWLKMIIHFTLNSTKLIMMHADTSCIWYRDWYVFTFIKHMYKTRAYPYLFTIVFDATRYCHHHDHERWTIFVYRNSMNICQYCIYGGISCWAARYGLKNDRITFTLRIPT